MATKGTIEVNNVSKRYRLGSLGTLRGTVSALLSRGKDEHNQRKMMWALRDLDFRVEPGESLGLIGPNGAGKTTTLRLLSNITQPTTGRIAVHGRASSLIELGAGFHPELTGRENIFLNGAILGLKREEIRRKLDAIVAFSELERFIDTPVKRYSSGMYVRLGFAVAAHVEPDVMLVDEVLAVGDASFRNRCIQRMRSMQKNGATVVFVSHNMHLIRGMCDSALLLMNGRIALEGSPSEVIAEYEKQLLDFSLSEKLKEGFQPAFDSQGGLILTAAELSADRPADDGVFASYLPAKLRIHYKSASPQHIGRVAVFVYREDGALCSTVESNTLSSQETELDLLDGSGYIEIAFSPLQLTTGKYYCTVKITDVSDGTVIASVQSSSFIVRERTGAFNVNRGFYVPQVSWKKVSL